MTTSADTAAIEPIPMLLFCPKCGTQHIDAPEKHPRAWSPGSSHADYWKNPPHKSHLCHACGNIWRPADVATTGVVSIQTKGKADTWDSTAPTTGSAPVGYALVPVRMTANMINAWSGGRTVSSDEVAYRTTFQDAWKRVLDAAPPANAPAASVLDDERMRQYEHVGSGLTLDHCPCGYCVQTRALLAASMGADRT